MLAAATDLAQIVGRVFDDVTGNGFDPGEQVVGATVQLYRDNGDGLFNPAGGDVAEQTDTTDANGLYEFTRLTAGSYFVLQPAQTVDGRTLQQSVSPLISIDANDVQGQLALTIDPFDTTFQLVRDETSDGVPVTSSVAAPGVVGGERDLFVNRTSPTGAIQLSVNDPLLPDLLSFDSIQLGDGERRVVWDGPDGDALTIDDTGLNGLDLTQGGSVSGLRLQVGADRAGGTAIIRIYSDDGVAGTATRFSTATVLIPETGGAPSSAEFLPLADFTATSGGGADLSSIGAIELEISGAANVNGTAELIGSLGSTLFTQNFANFESADLSLTKTVDDSSPTVGQNVTFTVTATNAGPNSAAGVVVNDLLPTGLTFVSSQPSQGTYDATTGVWNIGTLANSTAATLTIVATVNNANAQVNTAEISQSSAFDPDSTPGNAAPAEDDIASVTVTPETVDLALAKSVDNSSPDVGQNVTFTVTATNAGPATATGVVVRDVLPSGFALVTATPSQGTYDAATGLWTIGSLPLASSATLTLVATVTGPGTRTNTAEVTAIDQTDVDSTPNNGVATEDDQASVIVATPVADLSLTKTASNLRPNVGESFSFTVALANAGPAPATGVTVTDLIPSGTTFVSATVSQGSYDATTGLWSVGTVAVGATPTLTINTQVNSASAVTNTARITTADQTDPDSAPGNDVPAEDDQASITVTPPLIDLSLTKTVDTARPSAGQNVVFTLTLANAGPDTATGVVVADSLPAGLTFVSASPSTGAYDSASGLWTVGSVAPGEIPTLQITAQFNSAAAVVNTAQVSDADQSDVDSRPGNSIAGEDDQASITVSPATADLSLTKVVDNPTPNVGGTVGYTITLSNSGPDDATGVTVRDTFPGDIEFVSATPSVGTYDEATGLWTVGTVPASGAVTLQIVARALTTTSLTNTAEVTGSNVLDPDSTPNNNLAAEDDQATATIQPQQIDLALSKVIDDASPNVGEQVTFTITISNVGPSTATGVIVTDQLPSGVTLLTSTPSQGTFNTTSGVWTVGSITPGSQATLILVGRVDAGGTGTNSAEVTSANQIDADSTPGNNVSGEDDQASVSFTTPSSDLALTKTVSDASPDVGDTVTFTVTLTNAGPDNATGVRVTDILDSGLSFVSANPSVGTYDAATGIFNVGSLASAGTATLEIVARVDTPEPKTNTARVTASDQADPDSAIGNNDPAEDDQDQVTITPPVIDLSLVKATSTARPSLGGIVDFTVTVANAGPADATGVTVTDALPTGLSFVSSTVTIGSYDPATGLWTVGPVPSGGSATLTLTATVDSVGNFTNVAEVASADQFDADSTPGNSLPAEDDRAAVALATASADLRLSKTVSNATPNVGSQVTFTVTASNAGPDAAANVVIADTLPSGTTLVSANPSVGNYNATTGNWTIPLIEAGATATLELTASVDTEGDKTNSAEITASSQFDPDSTPGNGVAGEDDIATASLSPQLVDLALAKMIDDATPTVGDPIEYLLTLSNTGPSTATGVVVTDLLPAGVQFTSATPSQGSYDATTGRWTVGSVAVGAEPTLRLRAVVQNTAGATNTAEVTAVDQPDRDSTPGNGAPAEDDLATASFTTQVADLSLTKTVDNASPDRGDNVTFTLQLSNNGPDAATEITVADLLPAGLGFVSALPSRGTYSPVNGLWMIPQLDPGTSATLTIVATAQAPVEVTNRAEITASRQFDPDSTPNNNVAGEDDLAIVTVTPNVVDISVTATVDNDAPLEGDTIAITVRAANAGPADATGVQLSVPIPAGLTLLSSNPEQGSYDPATGIWTLGALAAGADADLVLNLRVDARGIKELPIETIATDQFDLDSTPDNDVPAEDDQTALIIRAPRLLTKRLFLAR